MNIKFIALVLVAATATVFGGQTHPLSEQKRSRYHSHWGWNGGLHIDEGAIRE